MTPNSLYAWWLASRPKTLTGAAAPVLVGGALAWHDTIGTTLERSARHYIDYQDSAVYLQSHVISFVIPFVLCLLFAFIMQIDANFINDYFDFKKGTDREDRLGPERACAQGWITPRAMAWGIGITTVLACIVGIVILLWHIQWELLIVGALCVLFCFLYTTRLSYMGYGDLLVLVFFGLIPVCFTYYVITGGSWNVPIIISSIGMGLATDNLLMVNNYRDRQQDRISGKRTIVVRLGSTFGLRCYLWLGIIAWALSLVTIFIIPTETKYLVLIASLSLIYLVLHIMTYHKMARLDGKELNKVLGDTARNIFIYGLVLTISILILNT